MKICAKQVAPECQMSPLDYENLPDNVYVFGNRHYTEYDNYKELCNSLENAADEFMEMVRGRYGCAGDSYDLNDFLRYCTPRDDGRDYTREERLQWRALLTGYYYNTITEREALAAALELITGEKYAYATISGYCQGDWSNILYPAQYGGEWLRHFEIEFFNMGAEWMITENDPDSDDNYYLYTYEWQNERIRAEIADAHGCDPADVVLYVFDGYIQTPKYKEVSA